jgi:hypothetical protein
MEKSSLQKILAGDIITTTSKVELLNAVKQIKPDWTETQILDFCYQRNFNAKSINVALYNVLTDETKASEVKTQIVSQPEEVEVKAEPKIEEVQVKPEVEAVLEIKSEEAKQEEVKPEETKQEEAKPEVQQEATQVEVAKPEQKPEATLEPETIPEVKQKQESIPEVKQESIPEVKQELESIPESKQEPIPEAQTSSDDNLLDEQVGCPSNCGWSDAFKALKAHKEVCPKRLVSCGHKYCDTMIPLDTKEIHEKDSEFHYQYYQKLIAELMKV